MCSAHVTSAGMILQREDPVFQRYFRKSWEEFFLISLSNFLVRVSSLSIHADIASLCVMHAADFGDAESIVIESACTGDRVPKFASAPAARVQNSTSQDQRVRGHTYEPMFQCGNCIHARNPRLLVN